MSVHIVTQDYFRAIHNNEVIFLLRTFTRSLRRSPHGRIKDLTNLQTHLLRSFLFWLIIKAAHLNQGEDNHTVWGGNIRYDYGGLFKSSF